MLHVWVGLVLASAPAKLAVPTFATVEVDPAMASFLSEHFAQKLTARGFQAITPKEMRALLGLERERQLLGCGESNCFVELAGAVGADAVVTGTLAKIGTSYQIDVKALAARDGRTWAAASESVAAEEQLVPALDRIAERISLGIAQSTGQPVETAVSPVRHWAWVPAAAGGALLVAGGVSIGLASARYDEIVRHPPTLAQAQASASQGQTFQTAAYVGWGVGGAALVGAGLMYWMGGHATRVAFAPARDGWSVALEGRFP